MAQPEVQPSRDEHEFWDRRFDDPDDRWVAAALSIEDRAGEDRAGEDRAGVGIDGLAGPGGRADPGDDDRALLGLADAARRPRARATLRPLAPAPDARWRTVLEWLRDRRGDPRLGVIALVFVAVLAGLVWYRIGLGRGDGAPPPAPRTTASADASSPTGATAASATSASATSARSDGTPDDPDARVVVHVAGAVTRPGVVELPRKARVIDALEAVGGATAEADVDRLNLAAAVVDGSRVYVPKRGEADPGVLGGSASGAASDPGVGPGGAKLNLNTATQEQLEALPGIGPTYALAIVAERTRRGGFRSVNELREVRGIGDKRFADLAPLVTV